MSSACGVEKIQLGFCGAARGAAGDSALFLGAAARDTVRDPALLPVAAVRDIPGR